MIKNKPIRIYGNSRGRVCFGHEQQEKYPAVKQWVYRLVHDMVIEDERQKPETVKIT